MSISAVLQAYTTHGVALQRFVYRFVRNPTDAEDIAQEAFLRAYVVERERPIEQPKSFLFRIAKHLALSRIEHTIRWSMAEIDMDWLEDSSAEELAIADEIIAHRLAAISALAPQQKKAYMLRRYEGLSQAETAAKLGIAISTVEKHMVRAEEFVGRVAA